MRLFLIRHGQTRWNVEGKAQGHTDIELDPHGEEQARRVAVAFAGENLHTVFSSDLKRSADTAQGIALATGAELILTSELRERSFGEWEGLPYEVIWAKMAEAQRLGSPRHEVRPPGGESLVDVWRRLDAFIERLDVRSGPMAIVSHGGTCSLLMARLIGGNIECARAFGFGNTAINELEMRGDSTFRLMRYDDTSHLNGLAVKSGNLEGVSR